VSDESDEIQGLKLVWYTGGRERVPEAPIAQDYPYKLEVNFSPPELMTVAFVMLHGGSEELVVRGKTREALEQLVKRNSFRDHPRLRWLRISAPDGSVEEVRR
jgi:hypothetical protein